MEMRVTDRPPSTAMPDEDWCLRGLRMDPLTREFVADLESYWRPRKQVADVTQYYRQY